jgi:multiple sugar transport system permease protein
MRLFEPTQLGEMAPATKVITYGLLGLWTLIVLFPLYWVAVTSLKLPIDVSNGPSTYLHRLLALDARLRYIFVGIAATHSGLTSTH